MSPQKYVRRNWFGIIHKYLFYLINCQEDVLVQQLYVLLLLLVPLLIAVEVAGKEVLDVAGDLLGVAEEEIPKVVRVGPWEVVGVELLEIMELIL